MLPLSFRVAPKATESPRQVEDLDEEELGGTVSWAPAGDARAPVTRVHEEILNKWTLGQG